LLKIIKKKNLDSRGAPPLKEGAFLLLCAAGRPDATGLGRPFARASWVPASMPKPSTGNPWPKAQKEKQYLFSLYAPAAGVGLRPFFPLFLFFFLFVFVSFVPYIELTFSTYVAPDVYVSGCFLYFVYAEKVCIIWNGWAILWNIIRSNLILVQFFAITRDCVF
jgi:hypothetical protein